MYKERALQFIEKGAHGSKLNRAFEYGIMLLIVLNILAVIIQTMPGLGDRFAFQFRVFEIFSVLIFSFEYLVRIYVSDLTHTASNRFKSVFKFIFSPYGIIDLLAIIPFYLPFFIAVDLRFLRLIRLLRFTRIIKINRYNNSIHLLYVVLKEKRSELLVTVYITFLMLLLSSFLMYYVEGEAQPDKFSSVVASFWWAIATLTTVGYGDVYPITTLGKVISSMVALLGIGIVALPTGIVSAGFMEKLEKRKNAKGSCPHCGK